MGGSPRRDVREVMRPLTEHPLAGRLFGPDLELATRAGETVQGGANLGHAGSVGPSVSGASSIARP